MLRDIIETERLKQSLSVYKLAKLTELQRTELGNFLKGKTQLGSDKVDKLLKTLKLNIMNNQTDISKLATLATVMNAKKSVFKVAVLKIRELEKTFKGLDNPNVKQQFYGYLMYSEKCEGVDAIRNFTNDFLFFYKENHNQLTDRLRKHDFINQFEYLFATQLNN